MLSSGKFSFCKNSRITIKKDVYGIYKGTTKEKLSQTVSTIRREV